MAFFGGSAGLNQGLDLPSNFYAPTPANNAKKGFGEFLRNWAGNFGDSLTGNPVYANAMEEMAKQKEYERRRQEEMDDYRRKKEIDRELKPMDYAGIIDEFQQAKALGYIPQDMDFTQYLPMARPGNAAPVVLPYNVRQTGDNIPVVSSEAEAAKLAPGSLFRPYPGGPVKQVPGGAGGNASGGFPRPY